MMIRRSIKTTKKRGTRSGFMVWLRVLWSLIEAEAEGEELDPRNDGSHKENHGLEDQEALSPALGLNVAHRSIEDDGHEDQRDDDHQGLGAGESREGR